VLLGVGLCGLGFMIISFHFSKINCVCLCVCVCVCERERERERERESFLLSKTLVKHMGSICFHLLLKLLLEKSLLA
jgi:hypothetical protein